LEYGFVVHTKLPQQRRKMSFF